MATLLGGLSLPRKSVVWLTDHPHMTLAVYRGRKTTTQPGPFCSNYYSIGLEDGHPKLVIAEFEINSNK